jgi:hypothetical protein
MIERAVEGQLRWTPVCTNIGYNRKTLLIASGLERHHISQRYVNDKFPYLCHRNGFFCLSCDLDDPHHCFGLLLLRKPGLHVDSDLARQAAHRPRRLAGATTVQWAAEREVIVNSREQSLVIPSEKADVAKRLEEAEVGPQFLDSTNASTFSRRTFHQKSTTIQQRMPSYNIVVFGGKSATEHVTASLTVDRRPLRSRSGSLSLNLEAQY